MGGVGKRYCGGPDGVEVVLDCLGATNALSRSAVADGVTDEEGVGEREEVFVG